ncbi:hypothetical protein [Alteromonas pelagimontana]|uniref:hypothetical protein n=1 Tax=Alteromonas pelagimontana TaxID=1858656 RepID=UPI000ABE9750|nr:hypothetical protein [Alteromonas pelagimontana]
MRKILPFLKALVVGWLVTYFFASVFHTQSVLSGLVAIGVEIPLADRLATTAYDIWGLLPTYGSAILGAIFISMLIAVILNLWLKAPIALGAVAGATALLVTLLAMQPIMHVTLIAGARGPIGIALQCIAGAIGGAAFMWRYQHK